MEEDLTLDGDYLSEKELYITGEVRGHLANTAKWAKFLAIIGFIGVGFMVIGAFSMGAVMGFAGSGLGSPFPSGVFTILYLIFAAIYFFPVLYLYNFATKIQESLRTDDQISFNVGMRNLSRLYHFMGILTVVMLSLYAVFFLFAIFAGIGSSF